MDLQAVDDALVLAGTRLILTPTLVPGLDLTEVYFLHNRGLSLILEGALKRLEVDAVIVTATTDFLGVTAVPVEAIFSVDGAGAPRAAIRFLVIQSPPPAQPWRFGASYPDLPAFYGPGQGAALGATTASFLDALPLAPATLVLSTHDAIDRGTGAPLARGLNLVGTLFHRNNLLGAIDPLLGSTALTTPLHGTIVPPTVAMTTAPLTPRRWPWDDLAWPVPGVHLQAPLDATVALGPLTLRLTAIRIFSPLTELWRQEHLTYRPIVAVTGALTIPSAGRDVDLVIVLGPSALSFIAAPDVTLGGLDDLVDLAGGGALGDLLPDAVRDLAAAAGDLVLTGASFSVTTDPLTVQWAGLAIALPTAQWTVADGFTVGGLVTDFYVLSPFDSATRSIGAGVHATLDVPGATLDVFGCVPDFALTITATSPDGLALGALLARIVPGAEAIGELELFDARLELAPSAGHLDLFARVGDEDARLDLELTVDRPGGQLDVRARMFASEGTSVDLLALARGALSAIGGVGELAVLDLPDSAQLTLDAADLRRVGAALTAQVMGSFWLGGRRLVGVTATRAATGGWTILGATTPGTTFDLAGLVTDLFAAAGLALPDVVPAFELTDLRLALDTTTRVVQLSAHTAAPVTIALGGRDYQLDCGARFDLAHGVAGVTLTADVAIGGATVALAYTISTAGQTMRGTWRDAGGVTLGVAELVDALGLESTLSLPSGIGVAIDELTFELDPARGRMLLSAHAAGVGDVFLIAQRRGGRWGFVFGSMLDLAHLDGFPSLGPISLGQTTLLLSTIQDDTFQLPALPAVPSTPTIPGGARFGALSSRTMPLVPGLTVAALLDLDASDGGSPTTQILSGFAPARQLLVQARLGANLADSALVAYLPGTLAIGSLALSQPFLQLQLVPPGVMAGGSLYIPIDDVTLKASGRIAMNLQQVQALFSIEASADGQPAALPAPLGLRGVALTQLALGIGVVFEPPSLNLGFGGRFNIVGQPPATNDFMIVLQVIQEVPNLLYLSTYLETIDVATLLAAVTGDPDPKLPPLVGELHANRLSLFWSERAGLILPDGTLSRAGFGFNGFITIASFQVHAGLDLDPISSVRGTAQMAPLAWAGVFAISGTGPGVTITEEQVDGLWRTARASAPGNSGPPHPTRRTQVMPPGGPLLSIDVRSSPFIQIGAKVTLFDLLSEEIEIEVGTDGLTFLLETTVGTAAHRSIACTLRSSGFRGVADLGLALDADLGPIEILGVDLGTIHLDVEMAAHVDLTIDAHGFRLEVSGGFSFDGVGLTVPTLVIDVAFSSFGDLPARMIAWIGDHLEQIFGDLFAGVGQILAEAGRVAGEIIGAIDGEVAQIGAGASQAAQDLVTGTTDLFEQVAGGLADVDDAVQGIATDAGRIATEGAQQVVQIGEAAAAEVAQVGQQAQEAVVTAANEVAKIGESVGREVAQLGAQAAQVAQQAVAQVEAIAADAERVAGQVVAAAQVAAQQIVLLAEVAAAAIRAQAQQILDDIAAAAQAAADWVAGAAEDVWDAVSSY